MTESKAVEVIEYIKTFDGMDFGATKIALDMAIKALEEIQQYIAIGTVEEFKALKEKSVPKKPVEKPNCDMTYKEITCPTCGRYISEYRNSYCDCGQKINWMKEGAE